VIPVAPIDDATATHDHHPIRERLDFLERAIFQRVRESSIVRDPGGIFQHQFMRVDAHQATSDVMRDGPDEVLLTHFPKVFAFLIHDLFLPAVGYCGFTAIDYYVYCG